MLGQVRRDAWNIARGCRRGCSRDRSGQSVTGARYALGKNLENLTTNQQAKLAWIAKNDPRLHRAYLL